MVLRFSKPLPELRALASHGGARDVPPPEPTEPDSLLTLLEAEGGGLTSLWSGRVNNGVVGIPSPTRSILYSDLPGMPQLDWSVAAFDVASILPGDPTGKSWSCVRNDADPEYLYCSQATGATTAAGFVQLPRTHGLWFQVSNLTQAHDIHWAGAGGSHYYVRVDTNGSIKCNPPGGLPGTMYDSGGGVIAVNTSHHIALRWNAGSVDFFHNGTLRKTWTGAPGTSTADAFFGSFFTSADFQGKMQDAFVTGVALSDARILDIYTWGITPP
jgi:Concanavalin A-like lectin/glucanases superfamily